MVRKKIENTFFQKFEIFKFFLFNLMFFSLKYEDLNKRKWKRIEL